MSTFLFDSIIFGPVWSRRLGESLGINLLPVNCKVCNFNCIYCECGLTPTYNSPSGFPARRMVREALSARLGEMKLNGDYLDSITFAGNGEPTLHPEFPQIMDDTLETRNALFPRAKITVLSNATLAGKKDVFSSLIRADLNILKLDSAYEETLMRINCPRGEFNLAKLIDSMKAFRGKLIIQTLFFRGVFMDIPVDNTTEKEVSAWLKVIAELGPECVMIYSIARDTAVPGLDRVGADELAAIADRVGELGIPVQITP